MMHVCVEDTTENADLLPDANTEEDIRDFLHSSHLAQYAPKEFTILGRRAGNNKTGKSKFYGTTVLDSVAVCTLDELWYLDIDDELVHVEDFVLNKCFSPDDDDVEFSEFVAAIDGGGWQGWHCEGSYFRSLFGLLFWDVFFYDQVPNTFLTPYQDRPLDLGYSSYFQERYDSIHCACVVDV
jgi:hypothetical protein